MNNSKDMNEAMNKLFKQIENNEMLIPKAAELNKLLSHQISFARTQIQYAKMHGKKLSIDILES